LSTADLIKEIALKSFANVGYYGTSIGNIASEVGIKKASIYSHISSKEALFLSILEDVLEWDRNYFTELLKRNDQLDVKSKFELLIKEYCKIYTEESSRTKVMFLNRSMMFPPNILTEKQKNIFKEKEINFTPLIEKLILEGFESKEIKSGSMTDILSFFYCLVDGLFVESCYYSEEDFNQRTESIWQLFWQSIKA